MPIVRGGVARRVFREITCALLKTRMPTSNNALKGRPHDVLRATHSRAMFLSRLV